MIQRLYHTILAKQSETQYIDLSSFILFEITSTNSLPYAVILGLPKLCLHFRVSQMKVRREQDKRFIAVF